MDERREYVTNLQSYIAGIEKEVTLILQSLQWDKNHLLQHPVMVSCAYDLNHKIPPDKIDEHERQCFFRHDGYSRDEHLLPDPPDTDSSTLVKLSKEDIAQIFGNASRSNPIFKKGVGCVGAEPMSLARLQAVYSADERRAIHDAVVSAVPSCHDLADLALPGDGDESTGRVILSRYEILAQLRNMRRRRTKYRVAAKTRNYSDVLRDVIRTQMEHYNIVKSEPMDDVSNSGPSTTNTQIDRDGVRGDSYGNHPRIMPKPMIEIAIKTERKDSRERNRDREFRQKEYRYGDRRQETRDIERNRYEYDERSKERSHDKDRERSRYQKHSRSRGEDYHQHEERSRQKRYGRYKEKRYGDDSNKDKVCEKSTTSRQHTELENRVKREPGLEEDLDRNKDRLRRSRERRYSNDSYQEHDYEERDRSRQRRGENFENQVKRKPGFNEPRRNNKERSKEARHTEYYEHRERSTERINVKQEREDSAEIGNDRSYERSNRKFRRGENTLRRKGHHGNEGHKENPSGSGQHKERSDKRYYVKQKDEYGAINSDKRKDEKHRKRYREGTHYDEPGGTDRHREKSDERSYIKQEKENVDGHGKKVNNKYKESYRDRRENENSGSSVRHRERSKQVKEGNIRDDCRRYDRDYGRDQRYDRDSSNSRGSSYCSCISEMTDRPRSYKRYYDEPEEAEYDPHKKIKIEK